MADGSSISAFCACCHCCNTDEQMKIKEFFEWIKKKVGKPEKEIRPIDIEDPFATIKRKTRERYIGARSMPRHNNRKQTRGRHIQYVKVGRITKPIYHSGF